jgi:signal transduction histidine kinase
MAASPSDAQLGHLRFFGAVSASISHEIKNVLAIIRERAGLIEDLLELGAASGRPPDPERLRTLAARIQDQTVRADGIVKAMNRLAHSVDHDRSSVDLGDLVALVATLSTRRASQAGVTLDLPDPGSAPAVPVTISSSPFVLLHALWLCLGAAIASPGAGSRIELDVSSVPAGAAITLRGIDAVAAAAHELLEPPEVRDLLRFLGLEPAPDEADSTALVLRLPPRLPGDGA